MRHTTHNHQTLCLEHLHHPSSRTVSNDIILSDFTPLTPVYSPPQGRMDLIVTDSYFTTILADVTITNPNPSMNQSVTASMLQPGYFSKYREKMKRTTYQQAARIFGAKYIPLVLDFFLGKLSAEYFRRAINTDSETDTF